MASPVSPGVRFLRVINSKDILAGVFFCAIGVFYGAIALRDLPMGRVFNMGPGFFPVVLCGLLLVIGLALILRAIVSAEPEGVGGAPWLAILLISASIAAFAILLEPLGLLLSIFCTTLIASFAAPKAKPLASIVAAAAIAVFCVAVFVFGAQMQAPVFGSIFGG
ncbi:MULTISPECIES: tripartite tricarboxylate transporter TctB family protein [unclassified Chelatococcus]|uniref:tripartite tricarboxylate transporter TctB family protein n=1 Tax=unclassified Chelatococcus TaxID=2638111 RepID=UPI001BCD91E5|nr:MULTISPECIES: tripartite tricarboxylate transporter TctB family protein [unclassified Chelatococcus]MBS7700006.1 tripartite tricarboxylate transporter TctB family protein [Chelatococcus sp. YT9]MBX3558569.1 tripartite tricarboxylate transporter TctB family protein [Chelatococcus sp.]